MARSSPPSHIARVMHGFYNWAASSLCSTSFCCFGSGRRSAKPRAVYHIEAPATTGHLMFERAFRIQMNTIENTMLFLPAVWRAALYGATTIIRAAGAVWIAGRTAYALACRKEQAKRGLGYGVSLLALALRLLDSIVGLVRTLLVA